MMKRNRYIILGLVVLIASLYTFLFNMSPGALVEAEMMPFSKDGFVDAETLTNTNYLAASNDNFELYINEKTSYFKVLDLSSGAEWNSNPTVMDPWQTDFSKIITNSALNKQKSTLEIKYFNETGGLASLDNYTSSISHPASVLYAAGLRTYEIKYTDNGFQVLYIMEDVDIDYLYFPKYLTPEVLATIEDQDLIQLIYKGYDEVYGVYEITEYEKMSRLIRTKLYDIFYGEDGLGYTREQAIEENASYGYFDTFEKVRFEIAIDVELTGTGLKTSVIQNSIVETPNAKLATVSLLPYFGTAISEIDGNPTTGYLVIPDGSGAVINFNNGKNYQQPYSKRLYGEDLGLIDYKMPEAQQKISIPLYGMIKEDSGFAAIITAGDTMATLNADVSGRIDSYNKVFPSFNFRENESITLGTGFNQYGLDLWTDDRVDSDFTVEYHFINGDDANYVTIAKIYQEYLEDEFGFTGVDSTSSTVLTTELIGAYDKKDFLFGVPYYTNESLTTFDEAQTILDDFILQGVTNINVVYRGMINGGLSSSVSDEFNIERVLGGKRDYNDLLDYANDHGIEIYPQTRIVATAEYNKMFDKFRYTSNRIDGSQSMIFNYHLPSKLPYSETAYPFFEDDYVINPLYYKEIVDGLLKDYDGDNISFDLFGSVLGGSYGDTTIYKQDTLRIQNEILDSMTENIILSNPLGFALPYTSYVMDLPLEMTLYAILDYQIPLLQLVLSGRVDYSTVSLNMANERTTQHNFLKTIETGSNLKYTLSYDNSNELRETEFNYYYSTQYTNWLDKIADQVKELDDLHIHEGYLIGHERIQNNVVKVTYSNGLEIVINYNLTDITIPTGEVVKAMDYIALEVE